tara:strand:- start:5479 stop:6165 length:687 start_codon:yes stop_codon:yes gene_type:complete
MKISFVFIFLTYSVYATSAIINGIKVSTEESKEEKSFFAEGNAVISSSIENVKNEILKFDLRCNQDLKSKRKFINKSFVCKFHNPSLVESLVIRKLKDRRFKNDPSVVDEFLVWRNIYNRNAYSYYDLIIVKKVSSEAYEVSYNMLSDKEVSFYLDDYTKKQTAFSKSGGVFKIKKQSDKTFLELNYISETDHWLLTSSMAEGTIIEKVATGTKLAIDAVKKGSEDLN